MSESPPTPLFGGTKNALKPLENRWNPSALKSRPALKSSPPRVKIAPPPARGGTICTFEGGNFKKALRIRSLLPALDLPPPGRHKICWLDKLLRKNRKRNGTQIDCSNSPCSFGNIWSQFVITLFFGRHCRYGTLELSRHPEILAGIVRPKSYPWNRQVTPDWCGELTFQKIIFICKIVILFFFNFNL